MRVGADVARERDAVRRDAAGRGNLPHGKVRPERHSAERFGRFLEDGGDVTHAVRLG
ncbi:hypothetical protein GCM10010922_00350 [Microbacterium sorbitolivorans]|nr:hypothetical protein GCM10010922_00350 [Microbacterium sorbitolivorans]